MADFCTCCRANLFRLDTNQSIIDNINDRSLTADLDIWKIFEEHIVPHKEDLLKDPTMWYSYGWICEGCGTVAYKLQQKESTVYLMAVREFVGSGAKELPIAIVTDDNKLVFKEELLDTMFSMSKIVI